MIALKRKGRIAALALAALCALCAGCGTKTDGSGTGAPTSAAQETRAAEPAVPERAAEETKASAAETAADYAALYAPVLDETFSVLWNGFDEDAEYRYVSSGVLELANWGDAREHIRNAGWRMEDVSGDGIPELLIGTTADGEQNAILAGYTCKSGGVSSFLEGWSRNSYRYMGGGRFLNVGSGGAMYSIFGAYRLSADGTELSVEDYYFTHEKGENFDTVYYFHNTTGEWDTEASEELNISDEDFQAILSDYEAQCVRLELTPFADYDYTGSVSQPLDCKVHADFMNPLLFQEYDDAAALFAAQLPAGGEHETAVVFHAEEAVSDFRLLSLALRDVDQAGNAVFDSAEVFYLAALQKPLSVPMDFPGDVPSNGFSYVDTDGSTKAFSVSLSGKDGSLVVMPIDISGASG